MHMQVEQCGYFADSKSSSQAELSKLLICDGLLTRSRLSSSQCEFLM